MLSIGLETITDYLDNISRNYAIDLHISGKSVMRIFGDFSKVSEEVTDLILDLVNYETVPVTLEVLNCIEKNFIPNQNGEEIS